MGKIEFLKILLEERKFHFDHPHEVLRKIIFSIAATMTSIFTALLLKAEGINTELLEELLKDVRVSIPLFIVVLGYAFVIYGVMEHAHIHREQRKRITKAIDHLLTIPDDAFSTKKFWGKFGKGYLSYRKGILMKNEVSLFAIEPDSRKWIKFHDRKIEVGIIIVLIGFAYLIYTIMEI